MMSMQLHKVQEGGPAADGVSPSPPSGLRPSFGDGDTPSLTRKVNSHGATIKLTIFNCKGRL